MARRSTGAAGLRGIFWPTVMLCSRPMGFAWAMARAPTLPATMLRAMTWPSPWLLACRAGDRLSGLVSVAGALRRPNTTDCAGLKGLPVMQVHGFADGQVPFEGRAIRDWHQGSLWDILERARVANGCRSHPDAIEISDRFRTRVWDDSCAGASVRLDIHDGGHGLPQGWTARAHAFFAGESRPQPAEN